MRQSIHLPLLWLVLLCTPYAIAADLPQATPKRLGSASPNVQVLPIPFTIAGLDRQRSIRIYLPPGYAKTNQHYPVLYMHDAQNLFDDATAFSGEWNVDEALDTLAKSHGLELIVVGIDNGGEHRLHELSAWDNPKYGKGEGKQYTAFIVDVLKPYIDAHYRSKPDRSNTAIMGSSLGGLISHYAIFQYPEVFGKAGIFSPSYWFAPEVFAFSAARPLPLDAKVYFYAGGKEGDKMLPQFNRMIALLQQPAQRHATFFVSINPVAQHNEAAWRAEFPKAVSWLFAPDPGDTHRRN
ncbi:alpha/beta hydrolase [Pseudolysobacter antarcticus]|uniref:Alpha/beta hydrolase n=1 Tax=Pseudolysobacter antarcticus TaxID=2511995 RepID=A0A411HPH6_9GAMM|nr:alpha/beta hydrolase-fold protein [Pseudolysobacter antarcticus]QBB72401.1 alpha/beta hydrolase [Pseudolysobacter antarcticus]